MEDNNNQVTRKCHQKGNNGFRTDRVFVRKFESADYPDVERIFIDGLMEMVPDTAFRGLKHHPESLLLLYAAMTIVCFIATKSFLLTCLVPLAVLCARCYYSRRVALGYLERAKLTDMGDIEGHYMKTPDSCLWVAVLEGSVVGVVVACALRGEAGTVELHRMSVDRRCRQRGVGVALGRKVLQYAADRGVLLAGCSPAIPDSGVPVRRRHQGIRHAWREPVGTGAALLPGQSSPLPEGHDRSQY